MNSTELWTDAWAGALPAWEALMRRSGWHPVGVATLQATLSLACLAIGRASGPARGTRVAWWLAATALLLLSLNSLFALDLLVIELMRGVARAAGWYESRRTVQAVLLVLAGAAGAAIGLWARGRVRWTPSARVLLTGLGLLATLATLRAVSLHATDELINTRLAGLSVGRLVDALGLALVGAAVWRERTAIAT